MSLRVISSGNALDVSTDNNASSISVSTDTNDSHHLSFVLPENGPTWIHHVNKWKPNIISDRYTPHAFKDVFCIDITLTDLSVQCLPIKHTFSEKIGHYNNCIKKTKYACFFRAVIFQFEITIIEFCNF